MKFFTFKKKPTTNNASTAPMVSIDDSAIHVMPQRYYRIVKPGLSRQSKIILWSSLIIAFLALAAVGTWWYLRPTDDQTVNQPVQTPVKEVVMPTTTSTATEPEETPQTTPAVEPTTSPSDQPSVTLAGLLPDSVDTDKDGLTDVEERLFGSGLNRPDTDRDTYLDGQELINGYDLLIAGSARLENSTTVVAYVSKLHNYRILQPRSWILTATDEAGKQMKLQTDTGEAMEIVIFDNDEKLSLQSWFDKFAGQKVGRLIAKPDRPEMIMTADELTVYFISPDQIKIVAINYSVPVDATALNFRSTFKMIYGSFEFLP